MRWTDNDDDLIISKAELHRIVAEAINKKREDCARNRTLTSNNDYTIPEQANDLTSKD